MGVDTPSLKHLDEDASEWLIKVEMKGPNPLSASRSGTCWAWLVVPEPDVDIYPISSLTIWTGKL